MKEIYNQIIAEILERSDEHSITKEETIDRISEVPKVYFQNTLDSFNAVHFRNYVKQYYPQFNGETT